MHDQAHSPRPTERSLGRLRPWLAAALLLTAPAGFPSDESSATVSPWMQERASRLEAPLATRLKKLVVPELVAEQMSVRQLLELLRREAREADPEGDGFNLFYRVSPAALEVNLTLDLQDIPVSEVLRYIELVTEVAFRYERHAVVVIDKPAEDEE